MASAHRRPRTPRRSQFEAAAREVVKEHRVFNEDGSEPKAEEVQVLIYSSSVFGPHTLRDLTVRRAACRQCLMPDA